MIFRDVKPIKGKFKCRFASEEKVFDRASDLIADEKWSALEVESISAEDGMIVLDLMKVVPTMPIYDGNEEWIQNQLGGDVGKAFDC